MKAKNYKYKNFSINTKIIIAVSSTIIVSILIVGIIVSVMRTVVPSFYNFSTVNTNSYSLLNQLQWSQTTMSIFDQLVGGEDEKTKLRSLEEITKSFEDMGTKIYISKNGDDYFTNTSKDEIANEVKTISNSSISKELHFFSDNGMVSISKLDDPEGNEYDIVITNSEYTTKYSEPKRDVQEIVNLIFSRIGFIVTMVSLLFILIIIIASTSAAKSIKKPILTLAKGANEIASGNLDYRIDYDSTNELGITAKAMNDMTEKLKESIEERNQAEQARKEMVAGLAHDLRTPLTSIKGYVEGIRDGIANTPEKQEQYIKTIYSSTLDMEKLLNELLDISKLELGNIQLNTEPTNIISFIDEFTEEKMLKVQKYDIDFTYNKPENVDEIMVMLDTDRFSRVLSNIAANSIKYAKADEILSLCLTIQDYEKSVIITIADNGIGIDGNNITHIFDTFYRADQARTKTREGSGIGLAVCKEIVTLHGGSIWASSTLNKGTTIHISLEKIKEENNE